MLALAAFPDWAVQRAFDRWVTEQRRRPSPGEIVILVQRELKPIADELARRKRAADEQAEEQSRLDAARVSAETATDLMHRAGFTPKRFTDLQQRPMALTFAEAEAQADDPEASHWTTRADPSGPDMERLRAARDANPLVQAARQAQARVVGQ